MRDQISPLEQTRFFHLRCLRSVRRQLGQDVTKRLVCALVLSRLDYCNVILAGLSASTLAPLQRVLRVAARVVLDLKPRDHISCALRELHWLPISELIVYKLHVFSRLQVITQTITRLHHRLTSASRCHFISVFTAGRQSRRLCRATDEPENGGSSIFHCCTKSVEPAAD